MGTKNRLQAVEPGPRQPKWFHDILNTTPNGIVAARAIRNQQFEIIELQIHLANESGVRMANLPEDCVGKGLFSLFPDLTASGYFEKHKDVIESGISRTELISFNNGGTKKWFQLSLAKLDDGVISNFSDVTELKETELEIENQKTLLHLMLNSSLNGVYVLDAVRDASDTVIDFKLTHVNDIFCRMSGKSREQLIGKSFIANFPDTVRSGIFDRNCNVLRDGQPIKAEVHYVGNGVERWYQTSVNRVTINQLVIAFNDVTGLKQVMSGLEHSNKELQQSNERLSAFTYTSSHDLKEPVRKIILYSDLVEKKQGSALKPEARDLVTRINKNAQRMNALIGDLLAYSKISNASANTETVSLNSVLQDALTDLEAIIIDKDAKISVSPLPEVIGDRTQLTQVFQNLISNAIKFQNPDTKPLIQIKQEPNLLHNGQVYHCISVTDNGIGFDQSQSEKIFLAFQRLNTKEEYQGTGIGLAIVKQALENQSGFVNVKSQVGAGTTFYLYFSDKTNSR